MEINKTKLISYILGITLFISTFKLEFKGIINKDKIELPRKDFNTSLTDNHKEILTKNEILNIELTKTTEPKELKNIESTNQLEEQKITQELVYLIDDTYLYTSNNDYSLKIKQFNINELAIKLLSYNNNWTLVKYNNQFGYVDNKYLKFSSNFIETDYKHVEQKDIVITKTNLNLRLSPTTESKIIKTFSPYTELHVIAKINDEWLLVKHNDQFGYINKNYTISLLEIINQLYPELNITNLNVEKIVYANTGLNIRKYNSTNHEITGYLEQYESVRVLTEYDGWYFCMTNEYKFGFINKEYTKELTGLYVIVDLSKQILYLYNNDELYYITPITSGKTSTPSDIGSFEIWYKGKDEEIVPKYVVSNWMPYNNNMEGLHDAKNREFFGIKYKEVYLSKNYEIIPVVSYENIETDYKIYGSNGCINIPPSFAKNIYEIAPKGTKVLVHK